MDRLAAVLKHNLPTIRTFSATYLCIYMQVANYSSCIALQARTRWDTETLSCGENIRNERKLLLNEYHDAHNLAGHRHEEYGRAAVAPSEAHPCNVLEHRWNEGEKRKGTHVKKKRQSEVVGCKYNVPAPSMQKPGF